MMLEPDLGTTVVLVVAVVAVLVAAGTPLRYLFGLFAGGAACVLGLIVVEPYRLQRLTTFSTLGKTLRAAASRPLSRSSPSPRGTSSGWGSATRSRSSAICLPRAQT